MHKQHKVNVVELLQAARLETAPNLQLRSEFAQMIQRHIRQFAAVLNVQVLNFYKTPTKTNKQTNK